ncbi:MAG TPA: protein translocase subunit SecF [Firmicutes bacterium]|nr:protein translocase subunit SecF [Bacillota bacterium]
MKNKKFLPFIISAVVILVGIVSLIAQGLNLGIDFRSGKIVTIDMGRELDTQVLEDMVTAAGGKDAVIKRLGDTAYSIQFYVDEEEFANMTPSAQSTQSARPSASPSSGQTAQNTGSPSAAASPDSTGTAENTAGESGSASASASTSASGSASSSANSSDVVNTNGYSIVENRLANMLYDYYRSMLSPEYTVENGTMTYRLDFGVSINQDAYNEAVESFLNNYTSDFTLTNGTQAEVQINLNSMSLENMLSELLLYNLKSETGNFDLVFESYDVEEGTITASAVLGEDFDTQAVIDTVVAVAGESASVTFDGDRVNLSLSVNDADKEAVTAQLLTAKMSELLSFESEGSDSTVSSEVTAAAFWTVLLAAVCMLIYIWFRFELYSGLTAIIGLLHDVFVTITVMSLFQVQLNATFIAALLTIIGYVINNTIIIFDRIRENSKKLTGMSNYEVARLSVKQSLRRTLFASITTLLTVGVLFILGVASVQNFTLPIIVGILSSMYTSTLLNPLIWSLFKDRADKKNS